MSENKAIVTNIVYVLPDKNWQFPLHTHEEIEVSLVLAGKGVFYCRNKSREVKMGDLIVKNGGLSHAEKADPEDPMEQICVSFQLVSPGKYGRNQIIPADQDPVLDMSEYLGILTESFRLLSDHAADPACRPLQSAVINMILEIIALRKDAAPDIKREAKRSGDVVTEITEYIDRNFDRKLTLSELAAHFFISEGNMSRQFRERTGYSVNEYIVSKRIGEAQRMLIFEDKSIKEIAKACGYSDLAYFYQVFKRFAHCSPARFRAQYSIKQEPDPVTADA